MTFLHGDGQKHIQTSFGHEDVLKHFQTSFGHEDVLGHVQTSFGHVDVLEHVQTSFGHEDVQKHVQTSFSSRGDAEPLTTLANMGSCFLPRETPGTRGLFSWNTKLNLRQCQLSTVSAMYMLSFGPQLG